MDNPMQWMDVMKHMDVGKLMVAIPETRQFRDCFPEQEDEINRLFIKHRLDDVRLTLEAIGYAVAYRNYPVLDKAIRAHPKDAWQQLLSVDDGGLDVVASAVQDKVLIVESNYWFSMPGRDVRFKYRPEPNEFDTPKYRAYCKIVCMHGERNYKARPAPGSWQYQMLVEAGFFEPKDSCFCP